MSDAKRNIERGDLYAVLGLAKQLELAPLVQIITSRRTNTLDNQQLYRLHKPDHTKYHWLIGNEIRLYGGNSWANLFRNKSGPEYSTVVDDVCKKIGIDYTSGQITKSERAILEIMAPDGSELRKKLECFDLGEDAWETIRSSVSEQWWLAKMAVGAVATVIAAPIGAALLAKTAVDPTYQVTVPCVLHIAFLRQKFIQEGRNS